MQKNRKSHSRLIVLIVTIVLALLAVGCFVGARMISEYKSGLLERRQAEVEAINQQRQSEYALALAEFQQATSSGANLAWPMQKSEGWDVVELDNYPLENVQTTTVLRSDVINGGMLLVNEWHSRPDDFPENELVGVISYSEKKVAAYNNTVRAFPVVVDAFRECFEAAKAEGMENYVLWDGYRTWDEQNERFQKEMSKYSSQLSGEELIAKAKKSVNYPGTSEFNSGLSTTVRLYKSGDEEVNGKNKNFFESPEGRWLYENSWRYGLVFRFPLADYPVKGAADKSYKTGVGVELRAFRYVGKGNAAVMHTLDLCLEEYIEYLMEHPHIAVFEDGTLKYEIYREYVGEGETFPISVVGSSNVNVYSTSLDNMGYTVTVFEY